MTDAGRSIRRACRHTFAEAIALICAMGGPAITAAGAAVIGADSATGAMTLRVAVSAKPGPFDPATARAPEEFAAASAAYEQLVAPDGSGELAQSWSRAANDTVWTFTLRPGHRFESGALVDAAAVKFSLDRVLSIGRGNAGDIIDHIAAVDVLGPLTIRITTRIPTPRLPAIFADRSASIVDPGVARHALGAGTSNDRGAGWLATRTAGSGPYRMAPSRGGGLVILDRNPNWSGKRPAFDRIVYSVISDPVVRGLSVSRGTSDIATMMPAQALDRLRGDAKLQLVSVPVPAFQNVAFNLDRPAFRDVRLRRAVASAIDTQAIVRYIRGGRAGEFKGPLAPGMPGYDPALYPLRFDPRAALKLARAAGLKEDSARQVTMIYPGVSPETDTVAQYIQAAVAPLGLKMRLERLSIPAYLDRMQRGNYDIVLMGFVATTNDASGVLNYWFDPAKVGIDNPARYRDPTVARLVRQAAGEPDMAKRAALHRDIARRVNNDLPYAYLQQTHITNVVRRDLTGYRLDPLRPLEVDPLDIGRRQ